MANREILSDRQANFNNAKLGIIFQNYNQINARRLEQRRDQLDQNWEFHRDKKEKLNANVYLMMDLLALLGGINPQQLNKIKDRFRFLREFPKQLITKIISAIISSSTTLAANTQIKEYLSDLRSELYYLIPTDLQLHQANNNIIPLDNTGISSRMISLTRNNSGDSFPNADYLADITFILQTHAEVLTDPNFIYNKDKLKLSKVHFLQRFNFFCNNLAFNIDVIEDRGKLMWGAKRELELETDQLLEMLKLLDDPTIYPQAIQDYNFNPDVIIQANDTDNLIGDPQYPLLNENNRTNNNIILTSLDQFRQKKYITAKINYPVVNISTENKRDIELKAVLKNELFLDLTKKKATAATKTEALKIFEVRQIIHPQSFVSDDPIRYPPSTLFLLTLSALNANLLDFTFDNTALSNSINMLTFEPVFKQELFLLLVTLLTKGQWIVNLKFEIIMMNQHDLTPFPSFFVGEPFNLLVYDKQNIINLVATMWNESINTIHESYYLNSGLTFIGFSQAVLQARKYTLVTGGNWIPTPKCILFKHSVFNPKNSDGDCLRWCILIKRYQHIICPLESDFNKNWDLLYNFPNIKDSVSMNNVSLPVTLHDIGKIESQNNLHINVFGLTIKDDETFKIDPLYSSFQSTESRYPDIINVLLFKKHFLYIHNINPLLTPEGIGRRFMCNRCIGTYTTQLSLKTHQNLCEKNVMVNFGLQTDKKILKFDNISNQIPIPFVIYGDFEAIMKNSSLNYPSISTSYPVKHHVPCGWYHRTIFTDNIHTNHRFPHYESDNIGFGENCASSFTDSLLQESIRISRIVYNTDLFCNAPPHHWKALKCYLCNLPFDDKIPSLIRVKEHCHLTGTYRGAAHSSCNGKAKFIKHIPVIFHNMGGYDIHLFIKELFPGDINIIAKSTEKYMSVSIHPYIYINNKGDLLDKIAYSALSKEDKKIYYRILKLRFIDSLNFLSASLAKLAGSLPLNHNYLYNDIPILRQKGFYPYEYMTNFTKFNETQLPAQTEFYSSLTQSGITAENYAHAHNVWKTQGCKTIRDYHDLYLKSDVNLLIEVFQNFRRICYKHYNLDPSHYITTPGLAWDSCLKFTGIQLDLIQDMSIYNFFETGIRGGVSICGEYRNVTADENTFIKYYDVNNLYGKAMCQPLPTGNFAWIKDPDHFISTVPLLLKYELNDPLLSIPVDDPIGYVFEVDLEYPTTLHDLHNAYPLAPEHTDKKLMLTLNNKNNYIVHLTTLQLYIKAGLIVTKVHRILQFSQSRWMEKYILNNTLLRSQSPKDSPESSFFKLMNNAVYGKTMENVKKRKEFKIARSITKLNSLTSKFLYQNHKIFSENLVIVTLKPYHIILDKPIYLGFCILDISKYIMYNLYYNMFKKHLGDEITLLYTDTDSLIVKISNGPLFKSNMKYVTPHIDPVVLGRLKDEYPDSTITSYIGLKAKSYAIKITEETDDLTQIINTEKIINKGISLNSCKPALNYDSFYNILHEQQQEIYANITKIMSKSHNLFTIDTIKSALNNFDTKRIDCVSQPQTPIKTVAPGHYSLKLDSGNNTFPEIAIRNYNFRTNTIFNIEDFIDQNHSNTLQNTMSDLFK